MKRIIKVFKEITIIIKKNKRKRKSYRGINQAMIIINDWRLMIFRKKKKKKFKSLFFKKT